MTEIPRAYSNKKSYRDEKPQNWRVAPALHNERKPSGSNKDPAQPKNK